MDFSYSEEQEAVRSLSADVFESVAARLGRVEATEERIDRELWRSLADTGLLGIALPEQLGGGARGMAELSVLLEQQGRAVAPIPLWPGALAACAIGRFGTDDQCRRAASFAAGDTFLTVALEEFGPYVDRDPDTTARRVGEGWVVRGAKAAVPAAHVAASIVVSATTDTGPALFLVDPRGEGVRAELAESTTREICADLTFDDAPGDLLGPTGPSTVSWLRERVEVALAAVQSGVAAAAVEQSVAYLNERHQFGRPLATFQSVRHQLADCYIDLEAMRVTLWQAAQLLDEGADPGTAVLVAKWWATDAGRRVVHRTQHVHGGIGVDTEYPLHRYLLWGMQIAATLGGSAADLERIGALLAGDEEVFV